MGGQRHTPTSYSTPYHTKQCAEKRQNIADRGPSGADLRNTHAARQAAMSTDRCPNGADLRGQTKTRRLTRNRRAHNAVMTRHGSGVFYCQRPEPSRWVLENKRKQRHRADSLRIRPKRGRPAQRNECGGEATERKQTGETRTQ
jgi:hypothetical protein